jgi:hypothetical protein
MNIGYFLVEEEEREKEQEKRAAATAVRSGAIAQGLRTQLAAVDGQIAEIKLELDQLEDDNPSLWPFRRKLVGLYNKHRELTEQLKKGAQS